MDLRIANQVALVTAASKGFGRAAARRLALEGCRVAICARTAADVESAAAEINAEVLKSQAAGRVFGIAADISTQAGCAAFVDAAINHYGAAHILVTNTGGPPAGTFETTDEEMWRSAIENTLLNVVRLCELVVPHMRAAGGGRIVNITSVSMRQPIDGLLLSNVLRPAIGGFAKTLALEVAADNILVNNVCPGMHLTDRLRHLAEVRGGESGRTAEAELEALRESIPLGRLGDPQDLGDVIAFLCSAAARFITGQSFVIDGGAYRGLA